MKQSRGKTKALITGVTGQDGSYLAKLLIENGYQVYGTVRRGGSPKTHRLKALGILEKVSLVPLEITELSNVMQVLGEITPDYIYNFAAQTFVMDSFRHPVTSTNVNYIGVLNLLEALRSLKLNSRLFQPSSSEMYGHQDKSLVSEETKFNPSSPYAIAKYAAHRAIQIYRDHYNVQAISAILFNHESELRGREFVTRKITLHLAKLKKGAETSLKLGNLSASRDWGYAVDYVRAMKAILENELLDEFVVATGKVHSVRDFLELAANKIGFSPKFEGEGINEKCYDKQSGRLLCEINNEFFRPMDKIILKGDSTKIRKNLGWRPEVCFESLIEKMISNDLKQNENELYQY